MTEPEPGWWAAAHIADAHAESPSVVIYREDAEGGQRDLVAFDLPDTTVPTIDRVLARNGWRRLEEWGPMSVEGITAQIARANGRPPAGLRVQTRLWLEDLHDVDDLIGYLGPNRSEVITTLVRRGLRAIADSKTMPT